MAKRKRLTPANPDYLGDTPRPDLAAPLGPARGLRPPIADIASDAAATAALRDVSEAMSEARQSGRMVAQIPLDQIQLDHLVRDRIAVNDAEMEALVTSIRTRGQQTPIEVVELGPGRFGLISGWRRCQALHTLANAGEGPAHALALLRRPDAASDAYLAMVEENEIRVGLSYYERARIALKAVEQGVFADRKQALKTLFQSASRAKRSKIGSFFAIVDALDSTLGHPHVIGERLGLQLSKKLETEPDFAPSIVAALRAHPGLSPEAEQALLSKALAVPASSAETVSDKVQTAQGSESAAREVAPGVMVRVHRKTGAMEIWGPGLTPDLRAGLMDWLRRRG